LSWIFPSPVTKGKVELRTGHERPESDKRRSSILSLTWAIDGDGWSTPSPGRFTPGKAHFIKSPSNRVRINLTKEPATFVFQDNALYSTIYLTETFTLTQ
jgi:hypothetical protein